MSTPNLAFPISALEQPVYIDGALVEEIAAATNPANKLEYADVCEYFELTPEQFTPAMFDDLVTKIYRENASDLFLWDDAEKQHMLNPEQVGLGNFSRKFVASLGKTFNVPTDATSFKRFIAETSARNDASAEPEACGSLTEYVSRPDNDIFEARTAVRTVITILKMLKALINDVDRERAEKVINYLEAQGCPKFTDLEDLIDIFIKEPMRTDINDRRTARLNEAIICHVGALKTVTGAYANMTQEMLDKKRQANKNITYTNFERVFKLQFAIDAIKEKKHVDNVLIVGPGLEQFNLILGERIKRQSYEPFAVIDALLADKMANLRTLHVDLVDLSDEVIEHFNRALESALAGGSYYLHCTYNSADSSPAFDSFGTGLENEFLSIEESYVQRTCEMHDAQTIAIHPDVVKRLKAQRGNIITDFLAADETYDMVVMLNTFMYFTPVEKELAVENIARLMTRGALFITDKELATEDNDLAPIFYFPSLVVYQKKE